MSASARRRHPRLLLVALVAAVVGVVLLLASGGPVAAAQAKKGKTVEVDGTAALKWEPATITLQPGDSVKFKVVAAGPHPVGSGSSPPTDDKKFDTSKCQLANMTAPGSSCTVVFAKAGSFPFFCTVHFASGMKGVIQVGAGGSATTGGATATTAGGVPSVTAPAAASSPPAGKPAIYWAGWGLLALGGFLALAAVAGYLRFGPGFRSEKR